jgi:hypothetical protein
MKIFKDFKQFYKLKHCSFEEAVDMAIVFYLAYNIGPKVDSMPRKPFWLWLKRLPLALYHNYLHTFECIIAGMIYVEDQ